MASALDGLSHKEQTLFKSVLKLFEIRQYKKGLRTCDQILAKSPNHGETLAMKGLFLVNLNRAEEGIPIAKEGVMKSISSSISWHVLGLAYRADRNFPEAIKCYHKSIEFDDAMLRDLAILYSQTCRYQELVETREKIVEKFPKDRMFRVGLAVAYQLNNQLDKAIDTINEVLANETWDVEKQKAEYTELLLYKNWLIELTGDIQKAYDNLKDIKGHVTDITSLISQRANLLFKLGQKEKAAKAYEMLIERNPDSIEYIEKYLVCHGLSVEDPKSHKAIVEVLGDLTRRFPTSNVLKIWPLKLVHGDEFRKMAESLTISAFRKEIPSHFNSMKVLYSDQQKEKAMREVVEGILQSLERTGSVPNSQNKEEPSCRYWAEYYLSQHYDFVGEHDLALKIIAGLIESSDPSTELLMAKAKILKHIGNLSGAKDVMNEARKLDLSDRFVNNKTAKYMARNGDLEDAENTITMFVRNDAANKLQELVDMQCCWYLYEVAQAHHRQGSLGLALKYYHQIEKIYNDMYDDQFDFHLYVLRKCTFRSYNRLLSWASQLFSKKEFVAAVLGSIECYIQLYDSQVQASKKKANETAASTSTNGSSKKSAGGSKGKGKTKGKSKKAPPPAKVASGKSTKTNQDEDNTKPDFTKDPKGQKYLKTPKPLDEALKLLDRLQQVSYRDSRVLCLGFEVYIRKGDLENAFAMLQRLKQTDFNSQSVKIYSVVLLALISRSADKGALQPEDIEQVQSLSDEFSDAATKVLELASNPKSAQAAFSAIGMLFEAESKERDDGLLTIQKALELDSTTASANDALSVYSALKSVSGQKSEIVRSVGDHFSSIYSQASCF
ncbi:hypothetical protein H4219_001246 [Mycoemilia scoparia]|uniref:Uncharacterized protein n=1 Tax=Mycoemilia scoparia TaxID=417184 RepID=A0A9W8DQL4_9FUNG|nr:hypothetical protein H4219_001246 [Mycoemilia scoparia]